MITAMHNSNTATATATTTAQKKTQPTERKSRPAGSRAPAKAFAHEEQLQVLRDIFPDWHVEDLKALLLDLSGDAYLAISRISEGHAKQWAAAGAKPASERRTPHAAPAHSSQSRARPQPRERKPFVARRDRPFGSDAPTPKPDAKAIGTDAPASTVATDELSWPDAEDAAPASPASPVAPVAPVDPVDPVVAVSPVEPSAPAPAETVATVDTPAETEPAEDDVVVRMPFSCNRSPCLVVEQPAVIMPIRACMRAGVSVRFGAPAEDAAPVLPVEEAPAKPHHESPRKTPEDTGRTSTRMTPISVSALESSLAALSTKDPEPPVGPAPYARPAPLAYPSNTAPRGG